MPSKQFLARDFKQELSIDSVHALVVGDIVQFFSFKNLNFMSDVGMLSFSFWSIVL